MLKHNAQLCNHWPCAFSAKRNMTRKTHISVRTQALSWIPSKHYVRSGRRQTKTSDSSALFAVSIVMYLTAALHLRAERQVTTPCLVSLAPMAPHGQAQVSPAYAGAPGSIAPWLPYLFLRFYPTLHSYLLLHFYLLLF